MYVDVDLILRVRSFIVFVAIYIDPICYDIPVRLYLYNQWVFTMYLLMTSTGRDLSDTNS